MSGRAFERYYRRNAALAAQAEFKPSSAEEAPVGDHHTTEDAPDEVAYVHGADDLPISKESRMHIDSKQNLKALKDFASDGKYGTLMSVVFLFGLSWALIRVLNSRPPARIV